MRPKKSQMPKSAELVKEVPTAARRSGAPGWAWVAATFFAIGRLRPAPGTWASLASVGIWWGMSLAVSPGWLPALTAAAAALALGIGIPAASRVMSATGDHDPSYIVIDEVAGQFVALLWAPPGWKSALASLILFRAFDVVKPSPLRRLERLPEGFGVMIDDLGAGLYALAALQLLAHWGWLS